MCVFCHGACFKNWRRLNLLIKPATAKGRACVQCAHAPILSLQEFVSGGEFFTHLKAVEK